MSTPFVGEIRMFGFGRTPVGWLACDGSLQPTSQYNMLYALLGNTFGGDGQSTFGMPDLRSRVPVHQGSGTGLSTYAIGQMGGVASVDLASNQLPAHSHVASATTAAAVNGVASPSLVPGAISGDTMYSSDLTGLNPITLASTTVSIEGGNAPHDNTMPTLTVQFCIATDGIFPQQN